MRGETGGSKSIDPEYRGSGGTRAVGDPGEESGASVTQPFAGDPRGPWPRWCVTVKPANSRNGFAVADCGAKLSLEEPNALIAHVRVCGNPGWQPPGGHPVVYSPSLGRFAWKG